MLFLLGCLFYKLHDALREQMVNAGEKGEGGKKGRDGRRKNMLYVLVMPLFDRTFRHEYVKEVTVLWVNFFKSAILAVFVANIFTSTSSFVFNLIMLAYLALVIKCPHFLGLHTQEDSLMHYWVYPFLMSFCFTLWCEHLIGYAGLVVLRVYIIFYMEFQLEINFLNCEYVSESQKNLVERVDDKFNRRSIDKLSIIPEEKEGISKMNYSEDSEPHRKWPLENLYKTILLMTPQFCLLLILCSQLVLYKNYFSAVMCLVILAVFFYTVKFIEKLDVFSMKVKKIMKIYFGVFLVVNVIISEHLSVDLD